MICTTSRSAWRGSTAKSNEWRNNIELQLYIDYWEAA